MKKHKLVSLLAVTMTAFTIGVTTNQVFSAVHPIEASAASTEYKNALANAKSYAYDLHLSKTGVYEQLTSDYDNFSPKAAKYALKHLKINWNYNALQTAISYQAKHLSKGAIKKQLTSKYEGFTEKQADYAIKYLPNLSK